MSNQIVVQNKSAVFLSNPYFTDDTQILSLNYQNVGDMLINIEDTKFLGLSFYGPEHFLDYPMVVPFQQIDFPLWGRPDNYVYNWDISNFQLDIITELDGFKSSTIYLYVKVVEPQGDTTYEYYGWQPLTYEIINAIPPVYTKTPTYITTDSISKTLTGDTSTIIRYVSDVKVSFEVEAQKGAKLVSYTIKNGSQSVNSTSILTQITATVEQEFTDVESPTFYTTVEDTRSLKSNSFAQATKFIEYFYPTTRISIGSISPTGGATEITAEGIAFNGSFGSRDNTIVVQYRYKVENGSYSNWISMATERYGDDYTASAELEGLNYQNKYIFQSRIIDGITTIESTEVVAKLMPVFDWGENDFRFNVPVSIEGNLKVSGTITDGSGSYESGTWTPVCNVCENPTLALGNYIRVGNVCTINFFFQGVGTTSLDFGLAEDKMYFSNLPFAPDTNYRWQAGGGNITNYAVQTLTYNSVPGDVDRDTHRFSGWSIEGGLLYGRTQNMTGKTSEYVSENVRDNYYSYWHIIGDSYYITITPGTTFYASGTISYKIAD